jgi:hypothetical protein
MPTPDPVVVAEQFLAHYDRPRLDAYHRLLRTALADRTKELALLAAGMQRHLAMARPLIGEREAGTIAFLIGAGLSIATYDPTGLALGVTAQIVTEIFARLRRRRDEKLLAPLTAELQIATERARRVHEAVEAAERAYVRQGWPAP